MTIIFYKYVNGKLVENDGWHEYDRKLLINRINRQNEHITYQALIRESYYETTKVWHELDLTKSRLFKQKKKEIKEYTIFDYI